MLSRPKFVSSYMYGIFSCRCFLFQQIRLKTSRRFNTRDNKTDDDKFRKKYGSKEGYIQFYKSKGQHILTNPRVLNTIVRNADVNATDTVLEIGPGTGNLTLKLLEVAEKVVAVEIDKRMIEVLNRRVSERGFEDRLTVIHGDALKTEFPKFDLVVANIPYGISSPIIAKLVFGKIPCRSATLLLQKEFARRLLAKPGDSDSNRLAVNVKLVAEVDFIMNVSKRDFLPCPKVDSSVVKVRPKAEIPDVNLDEWWAFTRTCFSKRNKTLGATFKQKKKGIELLKISNLTSAAEENASNDCNYEYIDACEEENEDMADEENCCLSTAGETDIGLFRHKLIEILRSNGFEEKRPSKLSVEELLHLISLFNQAGIYFHDQRMLRVGGNEEGNNTMINADF